MYQYSYMYMVQLKIYLRPKEGTKVMYGFHCTDLHETHNYSVKFCVL
jgi:hypothetical protein